MAALAAAISFSSCTKMSSGSDDDGEDELFYINSFGYNVMKAYYLWNEEIADGLKGWLTTDDPIEKVKDLRYKDADGTAVDRWTTMYDDISVFNSAISGTGKTYGFDYNLYKYGTSGVLAAVTYVYSGSPAEKAGLKRGDRILKIDGQAMTLDNYASVISTFSTSDSCELTLDGRSATVSMTAVDMTLDPVICRKVFVNGTKSVGYLHYTSFTVNSCKNLIEACRWFGNQGISELILDLRYNTGGAVAAECLLASMLAPKVNVDNKDVYTTSVYNKNLTPLLSSETRFSTDITVSVDGQNFTYSTEGANVGVSKIYALTGPYTASASEALICCLKPYIDIELIGQQTLGKFCSGIIYSAADWTEDIKDQLEDSEYAGYKSAAGDWGIYVMIGRYADKNGDTACMPSGLKPDVEIEDNPFDGYDLGDKGETLLHKALIKAGIIAEDNAAIKRSVEQKLESVRREEPLALRLVDLHN